MAHEEKKAAVLKAVQGLDARMQGLAARNDVATSWSTWKDWNDDYTKALQKRNVAEREMGKTGVDPEKSRAKFERLNSEAEAIRTHPNRPETKGTFAFGGGR